MFLEKYTYSEENNGEEILKQERFCILRVNISFPLKTIYRKVKKQ